MTTDRIRRTLCKTILIMPALPLCAAVGDARAATNAALRDKLHYVDHPVKGNNCTSCLEYLPSSGKPDIGQCKVIPGDDEIAANGYCDAWNTM